MWPECGEWLALRGGAGAELCSRRGRCALARQARGWPRRARARLASVVQANRPVGAAAAGSCATAGAGRRLRERRGESRAGGRCAARACSVEALSRPRAAADGRGLAAGGCARATSRRRGHPRGRTGVPGRPQRHAHRRATPRTGSAGRALGHRRRHSRSGSSPTRSTGRARGGRLAGDRRPAAARRRGSRRSPAVGRTKGGRWRRSSTTPRPEFRRSCSPADRAAARRPVSASIDALVAPARRSSRRHRLPDRAVLPGRHRRPGGGPGEGDGSGVFVSAGNQARQSWEGTSPRSGSRLNDFDPGAATDTRQTVATVPTGRQLSGLRAVGRPVRGRRPTTSRSTSTTPTRTRSSGPSTATTCVSGIPSGVRPSPRRGQPVRHGNPAWRGRGRPRLKWIASGSSTGALPAEYADAQGDRPGRRVGPRRARRWPPSGRRRGPGHHRGIQLARSDRDPYLDKDGNRLATPDVRPKPDIAGADGVATAIDNRGPDSTHSSGRARRRRARPAWPHWCGRPSRR